MTIWQIVVCVLGGLVLIVHFAPGLWGRLILLLLWAMIFSIFACFGWLTLLGLREIVQFLIRP